ncbi:hypothetical protein MRY82_05240 [bacterium]|nr:hypothetical protein [bacterium]
MLKKSRYRMLCDMFIKTPSIIVLSALFAINWAFAEERQSRFRIETEVASTWQSRNDVQIPGDTGTAFSLSDFASGPFFASRVYFWFHFNDRHSIRALYAPLNIQVEGLSDNNIEFNDAVFSGGAPVTGSYKFNSYRLAYLYHLRSDSPWQIAIGFSAKIRDARIALSNATTRSVYSNIGFVPLLLARLEYHFNQDLFLLLDIEALAAPQGRAEDATLQIRYSPFKGTFENTNIGFGYRTVEGGASNEKVNTFAWLHYLTLSVAVDF